MEGRWSDEIPCGFDKGDAAETDRDTKAPTKVRHDKAGQHGWPDVVFHEIPSAGCTQTREVSHASTTVLREARPCIDPFNYFKWVLPKP
jgi:hypothetical protein